MLQYIDNTVQQMTEALEDILLQMDSKLTKFAEDKQVCVMYNNIENFSDDRNWTKEHFR